MTEPRRLSQRRPIIETVLVTQERRCDQPIKIVFDENADYTDGQVLCSPYLAAPSPQINKMKCHRFPYSSWALSHRALCRGAFPPSRNPTISLAQNFQDRKSTRLNSSYGRISYAVFC